jgi:hypothetical protein
MTPSRMIVQWRSVGTIVANSTKFRVDIPPQPARAEDDEALRIPQPQILPDNQIRVLLGFLTRAIHQDDEVLVALALRREGESKLPLCISRAVRRRTNGNFRFGEGFWTRAHCDGRGEAPGPASESLPRRNRGEELL